MGAQLANEDQAPPLYCEQSAMRTKAIETKAIQAKPVQANIASTRATKDIKATALEAAATIRVDGAAHISTITGVLAATIAPVLRLGGFHMPGSLRRWRMRYALDYGLADYSSLPPGIRKILARGKPPSLA